MGEYSKALSYYEKALKISKKLFLKIILIWLVLTTTSEVCITTWAEYSKALSYYEKALEIRQKTLPANHPDLATSYNNIGLVYNEHGRVLESTFIL